MKDKIISFKTAKLAKEKGFDIPQLKRYLLDQHNNHCLANNKGLQNIGIQAPTQSLLQKYLREKHNLHIQVQIGGYINGKNTAYCKFGKTLWISKFRSKTSIYTYEEALEIGLQEALKLIKNGKKMK